MACKIVTVTHPDGTKKVIVGQNSKESINKRKLTDEERRPKPVTPKISISRERNGYKNGGKIKSKTR